MYKIFKASQIVLDKTFFHQCNIVSMIFGLFLVKLAKLCIRVFGINFSPLSVFVYLDILYLCIWIFCICVFGLNFSPLWKRVGAGYLGYNQALVWVKLGMSGREPSCLMRTRVDPVLPPLLSSYTNLADFPAVFLSYL